jgi:hypothetical protein
MAVLKFQVFEGLGNKCACCGEDHLHFMTVDHVQNDGADHRRELGSTNIEVIYRQVVKDNFDPLKWQMLCMNCNFAKGHYGVCPHKTGITAEMAKQKMQERIKYTGKAFQNYEGNKGLALGPLARRNRALGLPETEKNGNSVARAKTRVMELLGSMSSQDLEAFMSTIS